MDFPAPPERALEQQKPAPRRFGFHRDFQRNREHCLHLPGIEFPANIPRLISSLACFRFAAHFRLNFNASNAYPLTRQNWIYFKASAGPLPRRAGKRVTSLEISLVTQCVSLPGGKGSNARLASVAEGRGWPPPREGNFNRFGKKGKMLVSLSVLSNWLSR